MTETEKKVVEPAVTDSAGSEITPAGFRKLASQFNLHVLLIVENDGFSVSKARTLAWAEGAAGLKERMGQYKKAR